MPRKRISRLATRRRSAATLGVAAVTVAGLLVVAPPVAAAVPTDLFISEYVEGSSNNKAIEIFNGTGAPVDLAAGGYRLEVYFERLQRSGVSPPTLTGTVADGDVFVFASASAGPGDPALRPTPPPAPAC